MNGGPKAWSGVPVLGRRAFVRGSLGAVAVAAAPMAVTGCSGGGASEVVSGRLRMGVAGAALETLNVPVASAMSDYVTMLALFDPLVILRGDDIVMRLAEEIEANEDATEYTVRIREGVEFHDGRSLTADDVLYSLATLADPDESPNYAQFYADLDVDGLEAVDTHTVRVPLRRPRADFVEAGLATFSLVFPQGTTGEAWEDGIGSGPFRLASSEPGDRVLARNDAYWDEPALLDEVEIVSIDDAGTRMNAVRGGEIDYAHAVSQADAASVADDDSVEIVRGGASDSGFLGLHMNTTLEPFDDPDVRLAVKLLVDRQAMVETALHGQGTIGNDLVGQGLTGFAQDVPQRERDVDQARELLESSGVEEVTLRVAELVPGMTAAAELLVEQAAEAGLTVHLEEVAADTYFADMQTLMSTPFQSLYWVNRPAATHAAGFTGERGGFNVTGIAGGEYDEMLDAMQATVDDAERQEALDAVQHYLWEQGGDVVWGFAEQLDATVPGVSGIEYTQSLPRLDRLSMP